MIYLKTEDEIMKIRASSILLGQVFGEVSKYIEVGISTRTLDKIAESYIISHGGKPGFKGYRGYPATLCVSINDEVVHGIPSDEVLIKEGDIVSIDCGVIKDGYWSDSAYTFKVGSVSEDVLKLVNVTRECLYKAIDVAREGMRIGDIGYAIQSYAEEFNFSVVRDLVGHGVGRNLHEEPQVPNYGKRGKGIKLQEGMVLAIEPMVNMGDYRVRQKNDGWTIVTYDNKPSAHFEHTIVVRKNKGEILTTFEYIEEIYKNV